MTQARAERPRRGRFLIMGAAAAMATFAAVFAIGPVMELLGHEPAVSTVLAGWTAEPEPLDPSLQQSAVSICREFGTPGFNSVSSAVIDQRGPYAVALPVGDDVGVPCLLEKKDSAWSVVSGRVAPGSLGACEKTLPARTAVYDFRSSSGVLQVVYSVFQWNAIRFAVVSGSTSGGVSTGEVDFGSSEMGSVSLAVEGESFIAWWPSSSEIVMDVELVIRDGDGRQTALVTSDVVPGEALPYRLNVTGNSGSRESGLMSRRVDSQISYQVDSTICTGEDLRGD